MQNQNIKIGVNVIIEQNGKVLLGLRKKIAGKGQWGVPGGHLEFGEQLIEGVKRELFEETGLIADELEFDGVNNQPRASTQEHYVQINFVAKTWHGTLENKEPDICERWEWFDINNLPDPMFFAHKDFIRDYLEKRLLRDEQIK